MSKQTVHVLSLNFVHVGWFYKGVDELTFSWVKDAPWPVSVQTAFIKFPPEIYERIKTESKALGIDLDGPPESNFFATKSSFAADKALAAPAIVLDYTGTPEGRSPFVDRDKNRFYEKLDEIGFLGNEMSFRV